MSGALTGVRVLLVEDEPIIAMTAEDMLGAIGCLVVATAATLDEALAAAERGDFDVAVLDINLNGTASLPVAETLKRAARPFIFTTGYGAGERGRHDDVPLVSKPYRISDLEHALAAVLARG